MTQETRFRRRQPLRGLGRRPQPTPGKLNAHPPHGRGTGFTLIELLVVIAVIAILAALLLPALSRAESLAKRVRCVDSVRQIDLALQMYADDHGDEVGYFTNDMYYAYKECVLPYLGSAGGFSTTNRVFVCPADSGFHKLALTHFSSYGFNGLDRGDNDFGMAQRRFATVREPSRTALVGEISGGIGDSWHDPKPQGQYCGAPNVAGFVDGHVSYIRIYWDGVRGKAGFPFYYEPPPGYDYKWSGN